MKIQFTINGKEAAFSDIDETIREAAREEFLEQLRDYRCPEHGKPIEALQLTGGRFLGDRFEDMQLRISGCCDQAADEASALIGGEA